MLKERMRKEIEDEMRLEKMSLEEAGFPASPLCQNAQYKGQIWGKLYLKRGQIWGNIGAKPAANIKKGG